MLWEAVGLPAQGPQLLHLAVDRLEGVDPLFVEHPPEGNQHIAHRGRVVAGPVVVEGGQVQVLRHDIQLIFPQTRQQVLGQDQGVDIGRLEVQARLLAALADEADVEFRVVGRQGPTVYEFQKLRQSLGGPGGVLEHFVRDAGEADDLRRQPLPRVYEGLEPLGDLPVPQHHRADFRNGLPVHPEAGGLNIEADDFPLQRNVPGAVDGDRPHC